LTQLGDRSYRCERSNLMRYLKQSRISS